MKFKFISTSCLLLVALSLLAPSVIAAPKPGLEDTFTQKDFDEVLARLKPLAASGDMEAQAQLATLYLNGQGVSQDYKQSAFWFHKAASQGHILACRVLGDLYSSGLGVTQSYDTAFMWFEKSAKQGDALSQHSLALLHEKELIANADPRESVKLYKLAAEQGHAEAQVSLGVLYQHGQGAAQDYAVARKWYEIAAKQNNARAQNNLGILYTKALGVDQDYAKAAKWYRLAAENGLTTAMRNLGVLYENGFGVELDEEEAKKWYRKAGGVSGIKVNSQDAAQPLNALNGIRALAKAGEPDAQYNLGQLYFGGTGVPQDYVLAYMWINLAATQGHRNAITARGEIAGVMTSGQINEAQKMVRDWTPKP